MTTILRRLQNPRTREKLRPIRYVLDTTNFGNSATPIAQQLILDATQGQGNVGGEAFGAETFTFFPSVAVDSSGNVGMCFNYSNASLFGSVGYTGRRVADPAGTMQPVSTLAAGIDSYYIPDSQSRNRFGDYTGIALDPDTRSDMFIYGEYSGLRNAAQGFPNGVWGTSWGAFSMRQFGKADDFNGDGFGDLLLQYINDPVTQPSTPNPFRLWLMNGDVRAYTAVLSPTEMGPGVYTFATGDFNNDGKTDLAFRIHSNKRVGIWQMNGIQRIVSQYITTSPGGAIATSTPVPIGSGDLNGDGAKDLFFLNGTTVTCWYLSVATPFAGPVISARRLSRCRLPRRSTEWPM